MVANPPTLRHIYFVAAFATINSHFHKMSCVRCNTPFGGRQNFLVNLGHCYICYNKNMSEKCSTCDCAIPPSLVFDNIVAGRCVKCWMAGKVPSVLKQLERQQTLRLFGAS